MLWQERIALRRCQRCVNNPWLKEDCLCERTMLSCAVKRCRGRLCGESLAIFFLLPLHFGLSSSRCNKNNTVVSQTKHSHTADGSPLLPRQHSRDSCLRETQTLFADKFVEQRSHFVHLALRHIEISEMKVLYQLWFGNESSERLPHTLFLTLSWFIRSDRASNVVQ